MTKLVKAFLRKSFRIFGLDIHRIPEHERNRFTWLRHLNINTILDIGANIGQFATEVTKVFPEAQIYSFEPIKDVYERLIDNIKENKRIRAFNSALGNINGRTRIFRDGYSASSSLLEMANLHKEAFPFSGSISNQIINIKRLDDMVELERLKLNPEIMIKIDVQGYEEKVVEGGMNTIKKAKVVITEVSFYELYKDQVLFGEIYETFVSLGFDFKGFNDLSFHPVSGLSLFGDAVFVKK